MRIQACGENTGYRGAEPEKPIELRQSRQRMLYLSMAATGEIATPPHGTMIGSWFAILQPMHPGPGHLLVDERRIEGVVDGTTSYSCGTRSLVEIDVANPSGFSSGFDEQMRAQDSVVESELAPY